MPHRRPLWNLLWEFTLLSKIGNSDAKKDRYELFYGIMLMEESE
jgi:hypothetical protein